MDGLPFVAAAGGAFVSVVILRWAFCRYNIRGRRLLGGIAVAGALYVGCLVYFALGFLFVMIRPDHSQEVWTALRLGFRTSGSIILLTTLAASRPFWKPIEPAAPHKTGGNVRERLLKARADLEARIEQVRSSPLNYRGGLPETDVILEELADNLSQIDAALATPEQKN